MRSATHSTDLNHTYYVPGAVPDNGNIKINVIMSSFQDMSVEESEEDINHVSRCPCHGSEKHI